MCEIYTTRTSRVNTELSDSYFAMLNNASALALTLGYSIDAPEQLPSGSVKKYGRSDPYICQTLCGRDWDYDAWQADREALAEKLIAKLKKY